MKMEISLTFIFVIDGFCWISNEVIKHNKDNVRLKLKKVNIKIKN